MASSHLIKALFQTIPDPAWLEDPEGVYLACNTRFEELFGVVEAELVGRTNDDFVSAIQADSLLADDPVASGTENNEWWRSFARGGEHGQFKTIKSPFYDDQGKLLGVIGIARYIGRQPGEGELIVEGFSEEITRREEDEEKREEAGQPLCLIPPYPVVRDAWPPKSAQHVYQAVHPQ